MTGSIRLRRDDGNVDDNDGSGNICDSTFFYDFVEQENKESEKKKTGRLDMENLPVRNSSRGRGPVSENPLFIGRHLA